MSVSRKMLKGMGLSEEQQDTILEAHGEQVEGLKSQLAAAQAEAGRLTELQKQLEAAQTELETAKKDGWKDKHDSIQQEFEQYKAEIQAKESKAAKEKAARAWYESKGIAGKALNIAMRGSSAEVEALELDEAGKIKDASALEALAQGDFAGLASREEIRGADTAKPPAGRSGEEQPSSRGAELYAAYHSSRYGGERKEN